MTLARNLRPKSFSQVIGRELVCSMLQNSLFLKKIFSSYLFAGQRGCGKTTVARIFAAALNCENLKNFQENPKVNIVPCQTCISCKSMAEGAHPDFLELDAASNTGVDNIRQILESSAYHPCRGKYKVFLIDEAHMLSKAAFNALLKTLEEPPATAIFILATTEIEKIPTTIKSRSFLGFFPSLPINVLTVFIKTTCKENGILIEDEAVSFICKISQGCPRDALNLLDQMTLLNTKITYDLVAQTFGLLPSLIIFNMVLSLANKDFINYKKLFFEEVKPKINAILFFEQLFSHLIFLLNHSFDQKKELFEFKEASEIIKKILLILKTEKIYLLLKKLEDAQKKIVVINEKMDFIEFLLFDLFASINNYFNDSTDSGIIEIQRKKEAQDIESKKNISCELKQPIIKTTTLIPEPILKKELDFAADQSLKDWFHVLAQPILSSLKMASMALSHISKIIFEHEKKEIQLTFEKKINIFLQKELETVKPTIFEAIEATYRAKSNEKLAGYKIIFFYTSENELSKNTSDQIIDGLGAKPKTSLDKSTNNLYSTDGIDFTNKSSWPISSLLIERFPGKIILDKGK